MSSRPSAGLPWNVAFSNVSLRTRLALSAGLACVFVALVLALGLYLVAQGFVQQAQLARLNSAALVLESRVQNNLTFGQYDPDDLTRQDVPADIQVRVSLGRNVLIVSRQFPQGLPLNVTPGVYRLGDRYVLAQLLGLRQLGGQSGYALLTLSLSSQGTDDARRAFLRAMFIILPVVLLLACLASWWAAGRMLRPLAALEQEARMIGESGDLSRPLTGAGGHDELSRLAATLQESFRQLGETRGREVQFLRSAAHDLRGPLAALKTRVALSLGRERSAERYRQDLQEVGLDLSRLSTLAEHLLLLARNPQTLSRTPVRLQDVAADALDAARSRFPDTDLDMQAGQSEDLYVLGDRVLLGQAVSNLLQNAAHHAPASAVCVSLGQEGDTAVLSVHDDGPGVEPAVLARLGEAFYRPDSSRRSGLPEGGHGLGLAIVRHVAALHGGTLELESAPGQGFTARLRLPMGPAVPSVPAEDRQPS
ncbi:HAMP domain-containing sensor histidine kinase [Deinococcus radiomollis]|uniref:sensor histidine kinase n=1 Tax=Deinococcus radiomollis TaxID=468916 RepID=UPI003891B907